MQRGHNKNSLKIKIKCKVDMTRNTLNMFLKDHSCLQLRFSLAETHVTLNIMDENS